MIKLFSVGALVLFSFKSFSQTGTDTLKFKTQKDSASYAVGLEEARRLVEAMQMQEVDTLVSLDYLIRGYLDYMQSKPVLTNEISASVLQRYFAALMEDHAQNTQPDYGALILEAEEFMAANKTKKGIVTTASGLQYSIEKKGKGSFISMGDKVTVHYAGRFTNEQTFDSSYERNEPFEIELQPETMIQGWIEGLQLMKKGSKFTFYIPYDLGYGEMGAPPTIPAFAVLIFDIEVMDVVKK